MAFIGVRATMLHFVLGHVFGAPSDELHIALGSGATEIEMAPGGAMAP